MVFIFKLGLVCALAILSLVLTVSVGSENVKLEVYVESGCPISQAFILGELTTVLAMPDIKNITDYKYVPFGNSFVNETTKTYQCYDAVECETDAIQLCSMYKFSNDIGAINSGSNSYACFPFTSCMEANQGQASSGESCWNSTMSTTTTLTWETIDTCSDTEFTKVMTAGDIATPQSLTSVPWILVNGKLLKNPDTTLLAAICLAYEGPKPESCKLVA